MNRFFASLGREKVVGRRPFLFLAFVGLVFGSGVASRATEWGLDAIVGGHVPPEARESFLEEMEAGNMTWLRERSSWPTGGGGDRRVLWRGLRERGFEILPFTRQVLRHVDPASKPEGRGRLSQDLLEVYTLSRHLAETHRGAVSAWELLNEPDTYYADLPDVVATWQKAQYLGLKRGDGSSPVTRPPVGYSPGRYWEQTIRNGLWDYGEANNAHFYGWASAFGDVLAQHRWLEGWGYRKGYTQVPSTPLWVTEINRNVGDFSWRSPEAIWADQAKFWQTVVPVAAEAEVAVFTPFVSWWSQTPELSLFTEEFEPTPVWEAYVAAIAATEEMEGVRGSTPEMEDGRSEIGSECSEGRDGSTSRPPRTSIFELPSSAKLEALRPSPIVLQWVADESTTTPNKYSGTYRALREEDERREMEERLRRAEGTGHEGEGNGSHDGEQLAVGSWQEEKRSSSEIPNAEIPASASAAWQPIEGELRIYNFSNERVCGRLELMVSGDFAAAVPSHAEDRSGKMDDGGGSPDGEQEAEGRKLEGGDGSPSRPPQFEQLPVRSEAACALSLMPDASSNQEPSTGSSPSSISPLPSPNAGSFAVSVAPFSSVAIPLKFVVLGEAEALTYGRGVVAAEFLVESHEAVRRFQPRSERFALWHRRFPRRTAMGARDLGGARAVDFEARSLLAFGLETTPELDLFALRPIERQMIEASSIRLLPETEPILGTDFDHSKLPVFTDESPEAIREKGLLSWQAVRSEASEAWRWQMEDGRSEALPRAYGEEAWQEPVEDGRWKPGDGRSGVLPRAHGEELGSRLLYSDDHSLTTDNRSPSTDLQPPASDTLRTSSAAPPRTSSPNKAPSTRSQAPTITLSPLLCTPSGTLDLFYGEDYTPGYYWTSQAGPWSGINGMELQTATEMRGTYELLEFTVSGLEEDRKYPRAVARIEGGLPPDTVIFLRASRWFTSAPFNVQVYLIDRWGQAWTIEEQMALQPHLRGQNKYLPLCDFSHSYFSNLIPGYGLRPEEIVEIQLGLPIMEIPEEEAVRLLLAFMMPKQAVPAEDGSL